jgi:hypothetical protein
MQKILATGICARVECSVEGKVYHECLAVRCVARLLCGLLDETLGCCGYRDSAQIRDFLRWLIGPRIEGLKRTPPLQESYGSVNDSYPSSSYTAQKRHHDQARCQDGLPRCKTLGTSSKLGEGHPG